MEEPSRAEKWPRKSLAIFAEMNNSSLTPKVYKDSKQGLSRKRIVSGGSDEFTRRFRLQLRRQYMKFEDGVGTYTGSKPLLSSISMSTFPLYPQGSKRSFQSLSSSVTATRVGAFAMAHSNSCSYEGREKSEHSNVYVAYAGEYDAEISKLVLSTPILVFIL